MSLSDLPTIYDLTPDYASNLASPADLFWPGDQGRWQAANLADMSPSTSIVAWLLLGIPVGYIFYRVTRGEGLSGLGVHDLAKGRKHGFVTEERRCLKYNRRNGRLKCVKWRRVTVRR